MVLHNTILNPQQIFLKSSEGNLINGTMKSRISFELKNTINIPNNIDAYIQLNSFKFVNSFYNVNESNNMFYYSVSSMGIGIIDIHYFTIPIGNYTISTLLNYINGELTGYITLAYEQSTFKITVTANTGTLVLRNGQNSCLKLLGFNFVDTIETNTVTSTNLINLSGIQVLYLSLANFQIESNTSKDSTVNNILESVNINVLAGVSESFVNSSDKRYKIVDSMISKIDIDIYDENNDYVNFNNTDWYVNMSIIFAYKMEYKEPLTLANSNEIQTIDMVQN